MLQAVTSSGASEMVAISSLFTFDVYRKYINPKVCVEFKLYSVVCSEILGDKAGKIQAFVCMLGAL